MHRYHTIKWTKIAVFSLRYVDFGFALIFFEVKSNFEWYLHKDHHNYRRRYALVQRLIDCLTLNRSLSQVQSFGVFRITFYNFVAKYVKTHVCNWLFGINRKNNIAGNRSWSQNISVFKRATLTGFLMTPPF